MPGDVFLVLTINPITPEMKKKRMLIAAMLVVAAVIVAERYSDRTAARPTAATEAAAQTPATEAPPRQGQIANVEIPRCTDGRTEQIISHIGYTVSYNEDYCIPNWVAYELTASEVEGLESRSDKFVPDPMVTGRTATTDDYRNSGWDRGHMAPAADMKWSRKAMVESFYLSNICPQNHNNNAGVWKKLEEATRSLAGRFSFVYVVSGPIVGKAHLKIGPNKVAVPKAFFKCLLVADGDRWQAIGFVTPNEAGKRPLAEYAHSIDEIEEMTGIDFFPALPDDIEGLTEADFDPEIWGI